MKSLRILWRLGLVAVGLMAAVPICSSAAPPSGGGGGPAPVTGGLAPASAPSVFSNNLPVGDNSPRKSVPCPGVALLQSTNGSDYAVVFMANAPITATVALHLYGKSADYTATLHRVELFKPYTDDQDRHWVRSEAIDLTKKAGDTPIAATADATVDGGMGTCRTQQIEIPSPAMLQSEAKGTAKATLEADAAAEIAGSKDRVALQDAPPTTFKCPDPFANARKTTSTSTQPAGAASAATLILVTFDAKGQVSDTSVYKSSGDPSSDSAALQIARASTYQPPLFRCEPVPGQSVFVVEAGKAPSP